MELGIALPTSGSYSSPQAIKSVAQTAERAGYAALWTYERLLYPIGENVQQLPEYYMSTFEPLETLSYVAGLTTRIKLGTSIINAPFYSPIVLARRFATLDQFSGGRTIAGLGQGWMPQEFIATNTNSQSRGRKLEDFIQAMRTIWQPDPVSYEGPFYNIPISIVNPKPLQTDGIPILMGAFSPPAIKRAARIADGINPIAMSFDSLKETIEHFRQEAEKVGRDPQKLKVIARANVPFTSKALSEDQRPFLGGSATQIIGDLEKIRPLGIDQVFFFDASSSTLEEALENIEQLHERYQSVS